MEIDIYLALEIKHLFFYLRGWKMKRAITFSPVVFSYIPYHARIHRKKKLLLSDYSAYLQSYIS